MAPDEITRYAEFVYFHPFIRRFLYGDAKSERPVLRIFKRTGIKKLHIVLREGQELEFDVDRIHLYVFDIEVAILVMEISSTNANTELSDIQDFLDQFRRAYPPYWDYAGAGHSPQTVKFFNNNNELRAEGLYNDPKDYLSFVLLEPFEPCGHSNVNRDKVRYLQLEDERMPYMAYLAFDNPRLLTQGI